MVLFWVAVLAIAILLYVLLDGFDLGVGMLFGLTRSEANRSVMLSAVAPVWDGNETWLVVTAVVLWAAFPPVYATLLGACWLVRKCEGEVREAAYRLIPYLSLGLLGFLVAVFAYALGEHLQVIGRWLERPYLFVFPWIGIMAAAVLAVSVKNRLDGPQGNRLKIRVTNGRRAESVVIL